MSPPPAVLSAHDEDPTIAAGHPHSRHRGLHVGFASDTDTRNEKTDTEPESGPSGQPPQATGALNDSAPNPTTSTPNDDGNVRRTSAGYFPPTADGSSVANVPVHAQDPALDVEKIPASRLRGPPKVQAYTHNLRQQPPRSFVQQLKPYHGRLCGDSWFKVMLRPFVLFAYPAVLWSAIVYACSVGWLIVISETMAIIYRDPTSYNFTALQTGLVYISPFVGGILGTAVAGKISDVIVKAMAARNGGLYEPEFRLVMGIPILITTCIGLMGFGWSAQEGNHWIVPTVFFGVMSFGCSLIYDVHYFLRGQLPSVCWRGAGDAELCQEHSPRPRVQLVCHTLAGGRWCQVGVYLDWSDPAHPHAVYDPHVYLRKARAHVDDEDEPDGAVLIGSLHFSLDAL